MGAKLEEICRDDFVLSPVDRKCSSVHGNYLSEAHNSPLYCFSIIITNTQTFVL